MASAGRAYPGTYDPVTGEVEGAVDAQGNPVRRPGDLSILEGRVEMAAGRTGDGPVTAEAEAPGRRSGARRRTVNSVLFLLAVVLLSACAVGAVLFWQERQERAEATDLQEQYGEVLQAATTQAEAFVNIDYRSAEEGYAKVAEGATGDFKDQYDTSRESLAQVLTDNESVMTGDVLWAGVSTLDRDSATVLVATSGTVSNTQTENKPVARNFRLQLALERVGGRWLTADLVFVG